MRRVAVIAAWLMVTLVIMSILTRIFKSGSANANQAVTQIVILLLVIYGFLFYNVFGFAGTIGLVMMYFIIPIVVTTAASIIDYGPHWMDEMTKMIEPGIKPNLIMGLYYRIVSIFISYVLAILAGTVVSYIKYVITKIKVTQ